MVKAAKSTSLKSDESEKNAVNGEPVNPDVLDDGEPDEPDNPTASVDEPDDSELNPEPEPLVEHKKAHAPEKQGKLHKPVEVADKPESPPPDPPSAWKPPTRQTKAGRMRFRISPTGRLR